MINKIELASAELLLDVGVSVAVRPLRFLGARIPLRRLIIRRPYLGGILAMCRYYAMLGISVDEFKAMSRDKQLLFIGTHGQIISQLVACCICRGWLSGKILRPITAWWLRWRVHPDTIGELMMVILAQINIAPFQITINSAAAINLLKPRLSH